MKNKKGFSLVEVLLAMMILSMAVLTVFGLFGSGLQTNDRTIYTTRAAEFAQSVFAVIETAPTNNSWTLPSAYDMEDGDMVPQNDDVWHKVYF